MEDHEIDELVNWQLSHAEGEDPFGATWLCMNCLATYSSHHTLCPACGTVLMMARQVI